MGRGAGDRTERENRSYFARVKPGVLTDRNGHGGPGSTDDHLWDLGLCRMVKSQDRVLFDPWSRKSLHQ